VNDVMEVREDGIQPADGEPPRAIVA